MLVRGPTVDQDNVSRLGVVHTRAERVLREGLARGGRGVWLSHVSWPTPTNEGRHLRCRGFPPSPTRALTLWRGGPTPLAPRSSPHSRRSSPSRARSAPSPPTPRILVREGTNSHRPRSLLSRATVRTLTRHVPTLAPNGFAARTPRPVQAIEVADTGVPKAAQCPRRQSGTTP